MRPPSACAVLLATGMLSACSGVDAEQARICRSALPALVAEGARAEVIRTLPWSEPRSVRIEFDERRDGERVRRRFALCRFAAEGASTRKVDLLALSTDRGPVSGASLYFLKHYYVDTTEGMAGDPGPKAPSPAPAIGAGTARWLQPLLSGLPLIAIYGLLAASYALVFGLVGRINIAFGALASVGGTAAGIAAVTVGAREITTVAGVVLVAVALAAATAALHGRVAGRIAFVSVPARAGQASLVATVGLFLFLTEYLRIAGGNAPVWIPPLSGEPIRVARSEAGPVVISASALLVAGTAFAAALALPPFMRCSSYGRDWRAVSQDPKAAALFGVDDARLLGRTLMLAGGLAGLGGALLAVQFGQFGFQGALELGLKALAAAMLGGLNSVSGALIGGIAIGLFEIGWSTYCPIAGRDLALFAVLIAAIVLRAGGSWRDEADVQRV